ncbi:MAG: biotin transporter BioY [Roseovarius confluentis]|uniref:biotin transporter BioY n=1 Tax=Roseovarius sp. TaxID=1486281 RepID=UPI0032ED4B68
MSTLAQRPVLSDLVLNAGGSQIWLKRALFLVAGVMALTVSAKVQIASVPVPVTLQMLVVMVIGASFGPRLAAATVGSYLALGFQGLPVFAGAVAGPAYLAGPTGGYLVGFLIAAWAVGHLARAGWDRSYLSMAAAMAVGILCVYIPGVVWLSASWGAALGWENWYAYGVKTFIWVDALKLVAAVIAFPAIWKLVGDARA